MTEFAWEDALGNGRCRADALGDDLLCGEGLVGPTDAVKEVGFGEDWLKFPVIGFN